jgi:hypothetical protein
MKLFPAFKNTAPNTQRVVGKKAQHADLTFHVLQATTPFFVEVKQTRTRR